MSAPEPIEVKPTCHAATCSKCGIHWITYYEPGDNWRCVNCPLIKDPKPVKKPVRR